MCFFTSMGWLLGHTMILGKENKAMKVRV
jgi:hypothetical protein